MGFSNGSFSSSIRRDTVAQCYEAAAALLGKRESRKLGHNTYLRKEGTSFVVRLHSTDILQMSEDRMRLTSGGWMSHTTKDRLSALIPRGVWYLAHDGKRHVFADGITIRDNGSVTDVGDEKDVIALRRGIKRLSDAFGEQVAAGTLPAPSGGDCLFCSMHVSSGDHCGKPLGEVSKSDHVLSHVQEGYVVPSMLLNAARACRDGYLLNFVLPMLWGDVDAQKRAEYFEREGKSRYGAGVAAKRTVAKYLKRALGLAR